MAFRWNSLRDYRVSHGLTTEQLAERMGCDRVRVIRVERGLEDMSQAEMQRLSEYRPGRKYGEDER